ADGAAADEQAGVTASPAGTASGVAEPAGAADTASADEQAGLAAGPTLPAVATGEAVPAGAAGAADTEQPGGPAVAEQPAAGRAVFPAPRGPVGAVADQRAPRQRQEGRIDHAEQILLYRLRRIGRKRRNIGSLRAGIGARTGGQRLHKLLMKRRRLRTECLKTPTMSGKHRRNRRRHLI